MSLFGQGFLGGNRDAARNRPDGLNSAFNTLTNRINDTFGNPRAAVPGDGERINAEFSGTPWPHALIFTRPHPGAIVELADGPLSEGLSTATETTGPTSPGFYPNATWAGGNRYIVTYSNLNVPFINVRTEGLPASGGGQSMAQKNPAPLAKGLVPGRGVSGKDYNQSDSVYNNSPGFTPVSYFRTVHPQWSGGDPAKPSPYRYTVIFPREYGQSNLHVPLKTSDRYDNFNDSLRNGSPLSGYPDSVSSPTQDFRTTNSVNEYGVDMNRLRLFDDGDFTADDGTNRKTAAIDQYGADNQITPYDNEDPIYYAFDVIIHKDTSPLFNGELESFLNDEKFNNYGEIVDRRRVYREFRKEFARYFRFDTSPDGFQDNNDSIFGTKGGRDKKHYIQKIAGLDKLTEFNTPNKHNAFHQYRTDNLVLSFLEDTTLNMGTLYSLYKALYWSRVGGKSIIPENLLRFDMEIHVFEVRDFVRVKRAVQELTLQNRPDFFSDEELLEVQNNPDEGILPYKLEVLRSNISKYVYNVYECQFFFDKATHPASIDMSADPVQTKQVDVTISWKYSSQRLHRFNPVSTVKSYRSVGTGGLETPNFTIGGYDTPNTGIIATQRFTEQVIVKDYPLSPVTPGGVDGLIRADSARRIDLYNSGVEPPVAENTQQPSLFERVGRSFLQSAKTAVLEEGQRQLNVRFRLLNDALDRIRNAYGIGRMPAPTNVYQIPQGGQFFFDVQNSLRNFGGDLLAGALGG
jgi:hypothetical protein